MLLSIDANQYEKTRGPNVATALFYVAHRVEAPPGLSCCVWTGSQDKRFLLSCPAAHVRSHLEFSPPSNHIFHLACNLQTLFDLAARMSSLSKHLQYQSVRRAVTVAQGLSSIADSLISSGRVPLMITITCEPAERPQPSAPSSITLSKPVSRTSAAELSPHPELHPVNTAALHLRLEAFPVQAAQNRWSQNMLEEPVGHIN